MWLGLEASAVKDKNVGIGMRQRKCENVPPNSCSYIASLDLMASNTWLKQFIEADHMPRNLLRFLAGDNTARVSDCI